MPDPENPQTNPLAIQLDRKAEIEAELPFVEQGAASSPSSTAAGYGVRLGRLQEELFWIDKWLEVNADKYPTPPDAA